MRCLQCGKAIPLFKRLAASEFCCEAHRREYQQEYSQLALGRLLQSSPSESQSPLVKAPLASAPAPALGAFPPAKHEPPVANAVSIEPAAARPSAASARVEEPSRVATPSIPAVKANGIAKSQPPPAIPEKKAASQSASAKPAAPQPATAKAAAIQKPAPADSQFALVAAPEFEHAFASLAPGRPRCQSDKLTTELPQGGAIAWERGVDIADSITRPIERNLDLREPSRPAPMIALDLRIVPPKSLETERRPLAIPVTHAAPVEASLWNSPHRDFAIELASLRDFADAQFSKSDFEVPALGGGSAAPSLGVTLLAQPQSAAVESEPPPHGAKAILAEPQSEAPTPPVWVPDPELDPLPMNSMGIAPARAKPLPVFGPAPIKTGLVQIPQPNGLPLRPVMILATAAQPSAVVKTGVQKRKSDILSLRPDLSIKPPLSSAPDLSLPELPTQTLAGPRASSMRKILAALGGAAVLGAGIFFVVGRQSDAGLKSSAPAVVEGALGGQWIANFAPDAQRQRRVSVLRSSMNLSAYRLDFESSIRIKALGWVYRAQDAKNFYVSKIEFQKPGLNPVYALVHYAVIDGVEQPRAETPLHLSVPMGGHYKIRFEAVGNRFTTWIQGERVEQWSDSRLSSGGAGLYSEGVEQSTLHSDFAVTPLSK